MIVNLDDNLIYIDKADSIDTVWCVFNQLWKHSLYAKMKKFRFFQEEMQFLDYMISLQRIHKENELIGTVRDWPKP